MPLPVSSQTYMPNPLLYAQASQAGLDYGQDIVQGALDAGKSAVDIVGGIQDISMKPQKLELEQRKANQDDTRLGLEERRVGLEESGQVLDESYRRDKMEIDEAYRQEALDVQKEKIRRTRATTGIAEQRRADKELFEQLSTDFILDRNVDGIMGSLGDEATPAGRRRQAKFVNQLLDDPELAQGFLNTAEEALANDTLAANQRQFLERQVKVLGMHSKVKAQSELAQIGSEVLRSNLGVNIEKGERLDWRKDPSSGEVHIRSKKPNGSWRMLGVMAPTTEKERNALYSGMSAINRLDDIEKDNREEMRKSVEAVSDPKNRIPGSSENTPAAQQERPTKEGPTSYQRRGLSRGAPGPADEKKAIDETRSSMGTRPLSPRQIAARRRAAKASGATLPPELERKPKNWAS